MSDDGTYVGAKAETVEKRWVDIEEIDDRPPVTSGPDDPDGSPTKPYTLRGMKPRANASF